jgi:hypothetical protein
MELKPFFDKITIQNVSVKKVGQKIFANLVIVEKLATVNNLPKRRKLALSGPGLPDYSWYNMPKRGKYTKWPQSKPK